VEGQLAERLLLVHIELAEDLSRVEQVLVLVDSVYPVLAAVVPRGVSHPMPSHPIVCVYECEREIESSLLSVPRNQRQIQQQRQPVAIDQEQYRQERVDAGFGHNVGVQAVAEVDGVDVVAFEIGIHDGEEDLEEQVDGIEEHREEEQPAYGGRRSSARRSHHLRHHLRRRRRRWGERGVCRRCAVHLPCLARHIDGGGSLALDGAERCAVMESGGS
jgi:hypothetical protein